MYLCYIIKYDALRVVNYIIFNSYYIHNYPGQLGIQSVRFILSDLIVRKTTLKKKLTILAICKYCKNDYFWFIFVLR